MRFCSDSAVSRERGEIAITKLYTSKTGDVPQPLSGAVAQMVERLLSMQEAGGSMPPSSTFGRSTV